MRITYTCINYHQFLRCNARCTHSRECVVSETRCNNLSKFRPHLYLRNVNSFYNGVGADSEYQFNCRDKDLKE